MWKWIFAILGLLYILNPFDVMPDWLVGWGWLDDLVIFGFLARFLAKQFAGGKHPYRPGDDESGRQTGRRDNGDRRRDENFDERQRPGEQWDPYRVLALGRDATESEIKQAYRRLASQYHPDKVTHLGEEFRELAEIKFKQIQRAYRELSKDSGI